MQRHNTLVSLVFGSILNLSPLISLDAYASDCVKPATRFDLGRGGCPESVEKRRQESLAPSVLIEPEYPVRIKYLQMADQVTGKSRSFEMISQNGSSIELLFDKPNRESLLIDSKRIISWKSGIAGQGSDSSAAISTAVAGALFFWPMMLAAPFMVQNYTITAFEIVYVDEYGANTPVNFVTTTPPTPVLALLKFASGLNMGEIRSSEQLRGYYETGLQLSLKRLQTYRNAITVTDSRKPWCSYLDLSGDKAAVQAYQRSLASVKDLHKTLGLENFEESLSLSGDERWDDYLASRPGLKQWAQVHKQQANTMRQCDNRQ